MSCRRAGVLAALALVATANVPAQSLLWRNDWTVQAPPTLQDFYSNYATRALQQPSAFTPDGELLLRTPALSEQDDQIIRFTAAGSVRWRVNIGTLGSSAEEIGGAMVGNADGSAYVATQLGLAVSKIAADGSIAWTSMQSVSALSTLTDQAVAVLSCNSVSALDASNGRLLWTFTLPHPTSACAALGLSSDSAGFSYATFSTSNGFELVRFAPDGQALWQQQVVSSAGMVPFGVGASQVYLTAVSNFGVQAFAVGDGSPAWSVAGVMGLTVGGVPAEAIVNSSGGAQRLADTDGQPRWTNADAGGNLNGWPTFASVSGNRLLVGASAVDISSGVTLWRAALPTQDQQGDYLSYFANGTLSDGSVLFVANSTSSLLPSLQRVDAASGQPIGSIAVAAPTLQSILANSVAVDAQTIANVGAVNTVDGPQFHLRVVNADSGSTRFDAVGPNDAFTSYAGVAAGGSAIVFSVSEAFSVWVGAYARLSGAPLWVIRLYDAQAGQTDTVAYDPLVDADGNVYISYGAYIACPPPNFGVVCTRLSVVKLNAADGSIAWQHDDLIFGRATQIFPQSIALFGTDLLVSGKFVGQYATASLLKLSGSDGSVAWASSIYYQANSVNGTIGLMLPTADGNLLITGDGWAKLDGASGATLWSNPPDFSCDGFCYAVYYQVLPNGSVLFAGQDNRRAWIALIPAVAGAPSISWHPDRDDSNVTRSIANSPYLDAAGHVWMRLLRHYGPSEIGYLALFDTVSGTFSSQQAIFVSDNDPLVPYVSALPLAAPESNHFPAQTFINDPPAPFAVGNALVDSTITANGSLSVQVTTDRGYAQAGDMVNFHLIASYVGDAAVSGAKLIGNLPWPGFATGLSCTTSAAANCLIDSRSTTIVATFDVQPGGHVDISGSIPASALTGVARVRAVVAGPIGLNELDSVDNAVVLNVDQSIFADGFE